MPVISQVDRKVLASLRRAGLADLNKTLVVGVSGGPDSSTLLYSLNRLRGPLGIDLHVCHLNHDFRGDEADEDARFVESLAQELGLPVTVEKQDPIAYQRQQGISSFEQGAREMRYEFMSRVAHQVGAPAVAVGHTSDDLAETVLLHILRGAGLPGLRGMTEVAPWPWPPGLETPFIFRPLLEVSKAETVEYCEELGRTYRRDSGNLLFRFTRNRVRRELMPLLAAEYNPRVAEALVRLANSTSLDLEYLEEALDRTWAGLLESEPAAGDSESNHNRIVFNHEVFAALHPAIQRMALRRAYVLMKGDPRRLGERHLKAMVDLAAEHEGSARLDLPAQVTYSVTPAAISFIPRGTEQSCPLPELEGQYNFSFPSYPGSVSIIRAGGWEIELEAVRTGILTDLTPPHPLVVYMNPGVLEGTLTLRGRLPGDRFQPLGMSGEKKLQDFLVDAKVPREWRDRVPILISGDRIAWVVGYRMAEWVKVPERASPQEKVLRVAFSQVD